IDRGDGMPHLELIWLPPASAGASSAPVLSADYFDRSSTARGDSGFVLMCMMTQRGEDQTAAARLAPALGERVRDEAGQCRLRIVPPWRCPEAQTTNKRGRCRCLPGRRRAKPP